MLSALQLASQFPATVLENFYVKTRHSIEEGKSKAPFGFILPVQRDMTKVAEMVNILRIQGIEIGLASAPIKIGGTTYPVGSYVIKRDQPYGRLAKNLLEKQYFPDARLTTYDDSGWSMGMAMNVDVVEVTDSSILKAAVTPVEKVVLHGKTTGAGTAGIAIAHYGSNNMISLRYKRKDVPMKVAEKSFMVDGVEFPAGSFIVNGSQNIAAVRAAVDQFGLTAATLTTAPTVAAHDADLPRIAIFSSWSGTQNLGWYRLTFDNFGIPYDLIYKEQAEKGNLRAKYDVILVAEQNLGKASALAKRAARPTPYKKSDKYKFLGMYGETDDMSGGIGQESVDAFAKFLEGGGTLIAVGDAARLPIEFGWVGSVDKAPVPGLTSQRPLVQGEIVKPEHPPNNPIYRWQNHEEFNMIFNSVINWNDVPGAAPVIMK